MHCTHVLIACILSFQLTVIVKHFEPPNPLYYYYYYLFFNIVIGYARLADESTKDHPPIRWVLPQGMNSRALSGVFKLDWIGR